MTNMYLEEPSIMRKEQAINYINEFIVNDSKINGVGSLDKFLEEQSYEDWLEFCENVKTKDKANELGKVPSNTYFLIRKEDNKLIGMINFRYELNEYLKRIGGHIGYGIAPSERKKGYGKVQLYLCLLKAKEKALDKVMVTCDITNTASAKTIEALGGIFEREEFEKEKNRTLKIYWINVDKSIEKYEYLIK